MVRISAPRLGLDNYIEVVHIVNNEMQTPVDASYAVGWYPEYLAPGSPGNSIFSAHETWNHFQGPFYGMHNAQPGDDVYVDMTDGQRLHYRVFSFNRYPVASMPMAEIIWPSNRPANEEWLTLLTCGGRIVYDHTGFGEYLDRDVVVAKRVP
jgi:sortase (surface protein transpeptidase)